MLVRVAFDPIKLRVLAESKEEENWKFRQFLKVECELDSDDLDAALHEHGLERVEQMKVATLEEDGSISIVPQESDDNPSARRRRRRYKRRTF